MGVTDVVANGISSVTGKIARATIKIKDKRQEWNNAAIIMQEGVSAGGGGLGGLGGAASGFTNKVGNVIGKGLDKLSGDALGLNNIEKLKNSVKDGYNKVFEVQFNPSTLTVSGRGGGTRFDTDHSAGTVSASSGDDKVFITLSTRLIFNKVDLASSFPADAINFSLTNAANTAVKGVKGLFTDAGPSVQTTVEGFIAALRSPNTTEVAFEWGDLFYAGLLKSVSANYTMFDTTGKPVRAEVSLSLYLLDEDIRTIPSVSLGYWQAAYDDAFSSSESYIGTAQKVLRSVAKFIP